MAFFTLVSAVVSSQNSCIMLSVPKLVIALQSLEILFCSFSYVVGNAAVLGTTSVFKQGGLDQGIL